MTLKHSELTSKIPAKFYELLGSFKKSIGVEFYHQFITGGNLYYNPCKFQNDTELDTAIQEHFYRDKILETSAKRFRGSLAMKPMIGDYLRWICFDLDSAAEVERAKPLMLKLKELKIDFLEEFGGDQLDRRHLWIRVESKQSFAKEFFITLLMEVYNFKDQFEPFSEGNFQEVFGINKPNNVVRLPLGFHLRRSIRHPILLPNGFPSTDPVEFMEAWLAMSPVDEAKMVEIFKTFTVKIKKPEEINSQDDYGPFTYFPRKLPLPVQVPRLLRNCVANCQAINSVLEDVVNEEMIKKPGEIHHSAGLYLSGLAAFNDAILSKKNNKIWTEGKKWFEELVNRYRLRDDSSHNWTSNRKKAETNPYRVFASCQAWEEKFNKCQGCPYKPSIKSPRQLIYGKAIYRNLLHQIKLTTAEEIRATTFVDAKKHIHKLLEEGKSEDILLGSPMGSGKSYWVDEVACELKHNNNKILIAVPTTKLALEHKRRLRECGVESFILASHKSIFSEEHGISKFECPEYDPIQELLKLGVASKNIKNSFCATCPFVEECYYPSQYKQVMEEQHQVVIIQHAHFSVSEVLYELMKKRFDVMFIDESFINSCYSSIPIIETETQFLEEYKDFDWCSKLSRWLRGQLKAKGELEPDADELKLVKALFDNAGMVWRVPDLLRYYNQKRTVNPDVGIEIVYELPKIPIRVFTDATPPQSLIKHLTGINKLTVFGDKEILDHREIHPDNRVVQVLNFSTSVTSLSRQEKFEDILMKVGELAELKFKDKRILITAYKKDFNRIETFFKLHPEEFPSIAGRLEINTNVEKYDTIMLDNMDKGTNKYKDYDVQFLLAGFYYTGNQYALDTYRYKTVANYYNRKYDLPELANLYPDMEEEINADQEFIPIERIEVSQGRPGRYEYPNLTKPVPTDTWNRLCYNYNVANTQQAIRLRFTTEKQRIIYILNNLLLPTFLITDSVKIEDFIKPLEDSKELM